MGSEYIRLLGAEEVSQAASNIRAAADQFSRSAASFDNTVDRLVRVLEEHACRVEAAMAEPEPCRVMVSERVQDADRRWITREKGPAMFLRWGMEYEEFENGAGNQSVAIVQFPDGAIDTVVPHLIRFEVST